MHNITRIFRASLTAVAATTLIACGGHDDHDDQGDGDSDGGSDHAHEAPHAAQGGFLVALEDHVVNVEFLIDAATGTMTMYTLGGHAEKSVRSPSESVVITVAPEGGGSFDVTLAAQASKLSKETVGDSSLFVGQSDSLKGVEHFAGTIKALSLKGSDYLNVSFEFPADHDDHDGDDHDDHDGDDGHDDDHDH